MTILERVQQLEPFMINEVPCVIIGTNYGSDWDAITDVKEKTDCDLSKNGKELGDLDFEQRLEWAKDELKDEIQNKTPDEAFEHFKNLTEPDNANYWGGMIAVYTNEKTDSLEIMVRMD